MNAEINEVTQPEIDNLKLIVEQADADDDETRRPRVVVKLYNNGSRRISLTVGYSSVFSAGLSEGTNAALMEVSDEGGYRLEDMALDSVSIEHHLDGGETISQAFDIWNIPEALEDRPPYGTHTFVSQYEVHTTDDDEPVTAEGSFTVTIE